MHWSRLAVVSLLTATALVAAEPQKIAPKAAAELVATGKAVLVDVREPAEWAETGVAAPAVLLPKSDFDGAQKQWSEFLRQAGKDRQLVLYCRTGRRSAAVAAELAKRGLNVANAGGFDDWKKAGLPVRSVSEKTGTH